MENSKTFETIIIIMKQWPFLLVVFIIVVTFIKWKTIWKAIASLSGIKFKQGETEIEFNAVHINKIPTAGTELKKTESLEETKTGIKEETPSLYECYLKLKDNKSDEAIKIFKQIQQKAKPEEIIENEFVFLFYKYILGECTDDEFKSKINGISDPIIKSRGFKYLGMSYKMTKQYEKAIESYRKALIDLKDEFEITKLIINISQSHLENIDYSSAVSIVIEYLSTVKHDSNKADLYYQLSKVYDAQKDPFYKIVVLEKAASLKGNNTTYLFDSAHSYSAGDFKEAGVYQYSRLLTIDSDNPGALNNLGVSFQEKKLPIKAVEYYKKSVELNNSLAAANLANLYIYAGFQDEANKLFKDFINKSDVHENLIIAQSTLNSEKENQQKQANSLLDEGQKFSKFFNDYGHFYYEHEVLPEMRDENWFTQEGNKVRVIIDKSNLEITWRIPNTHLGDDDVFSIKGIIHRSACQVTLEFPKTNMPSTWELAYNKDKKPTRTINKYEGYCILNIIKGKIEIIFKEGEQFKFSLLTRHE